ncbi:transmembrane 7 superfamily member 3-like [Frieseomelitta varia]|uniref:transmembrane 7 superfamily member 3-like n=1 Tax=Frieseomelitta varia TaxID=561572 RepID=UPI001CB6A410|nr:transmembrane 7 superfamily member 3-like [Frieseomelitta varia]
MSRTFIGDLLIFLSLVVASLAKEKLTNTLFLGDGSVFQVNLTRLHDYSPYTKRIAIEANSKSVFNITNVSSSASFIIFQIHTYQYNVTFSYDKDYLDSNRSVFGSNVGLFSKLTTNIVTQLYVKNDNVHKVEALLVAIAYHDKSPVPGGCNMEFNTEIAPYAMVQTGDTMIIVDVQPASAPFNSVRPNCEKNVVTVEMYHMFLSSWDFSLDSYFAAIINMLTVTDIKENGVEVTSSSVFSPMRRVFNAYTGVGSVYVAVATYGDYSAAYVPAFSYACHPITDPDSCKILSGFWSNLFCVLCFFVGLLSLCLGHYQILIDMAVPMLFMGTVIGYAALGNIGLALLMGLGFIVVWIASKLISIFNKLILNLTLGWFFGCVVYFNSPDSFTILQNNGIFWTFFVFLSLGIALIILLFDDVASVITCATFSSFMVILSLDYWIGSTLKYIIINFIRRITVEGFNLAIIGPPIHTIDICLIVLWSCLALFRFSKQWCSRGYSSELVETDPLLPHF